MDDYIDFEQKKQSPYKGQILFAAHYIDRVIQTDWRKESANKFNEVTSTAYLASMVGMSKRNFEIIFKAYFHEPVQKYLSRLRENYALTLMKDRKRKLIDIAEQIGFANQSALNDLLGKNLYQTPREIQAKLSSQKNIYPFEIPLPRIEQMDKKSVIFLSFIGDYSTFASSVFEECSWDNLYEYADQHNLLDTNTEYWGITFDDTDITQSGKCRFYACLTISVCENYNLSITDTIKQMNLPKHIYAVYTHKGDYSLLDSFYDTIIREFPYELDDTPILERYLNSPVDTTKEELLTEVWFPILM